MKTDQKKGLLLSLAVLVCVSSGRAVLVILTDTIMNGLLIGGILFICGLVPVLYVYKLRIERREEIPGREMNKEITIHRFGEKAILRRPGGKDGFFFCG